MPQSERDLLEAQLADAGLPDAYRDAFADVLAEYPDSFLLSGAAAGNPVSGLIADAGSPFHAQAAACLRGISGDDWDAETALLSDGRFRVGCIRGRYHAERAAGFVGAAARQKNRERQIQQLEERLAEVSKQVQKARDDSARCEASLEALEKDRATMPDAQDLNAAIDMREKAERDLQRAEEERTRAQNAERNQKLVLSTLEREVREAASGLPYARTIPDYEEARDKVGEYQQTLFEAGQALTELRSAAQLLKAASYTLELLQGEIERQSDAVRALRRGLESEQARARTIQEDLDSPENRDRARRIRELGDKIQKLTLDIQEAVKQCAALETEWRMSGTSVAEKRTELERASATRRNAHSISRKICPWL